MIVNVPVASHYSTLELARVLVQVFKLGAKNPYWDQPPRTGPPATTRYRTIPCPRCFLQHDTQLALASCISNHLVRDDKWLDDRSVSDVLLQANMWESRLMELMPDDIRHKTTDLVVAVMAITTRHQLALEQLALAVGESRSLLFTNNAAIEAVNELAKLVYAALATPLEEVPSAH